MKLYADDTVIYSTRKTEGTAYANVEKDLNVLMKWCENNQSKIRRYINTHQALSIYKSMSMP